MPHYSQKGGYLVGHIQLLNGRLFNRFLSEIGDVAYTAEQGKILSVLCTGEMLTATDISLKTGLANNTLTSMLTRLENQGMIFALPCPKDKRKKYYQLTDLGKLQKELGQPASQKLSEVFYQGFSKVEQEELESYLERVLDNLKTEYEKERWRNESNRC